MANKGSTKTYLNLLDFCLKLEDPSGLKHHADEIFIRILSEYFFQNEVSQSKKIEQMLQNLEVPLFLKDRLTVHDLSTQSISEYINGTSLNDSLAGKIMLSREYLTVFYPHHPPAFAQLPADIKEEVIERIKNKNKAIIGAFEKIEQDRMADRNRTLLMLVSLILKNVHLRSGRPLKQQEHPVAEILRGMILNPMDIFYGDPIQINQLRDDRFIKDLIKKFFPIRTYKEIQELVALYNNELERFKRRAISVFENSDT